jgi:hypothetical protein
MLNLSAYSRKWLSGQIKRGKCYPWHMRKHSFPALLTAQSCVWVQVKDGNLLPASRSVVTDAVPKPSDYKG